MGRDNKGRIVEFDIFNLRKNISMAMEGKGVKPTTLSNKICGNPTLIKDLMEKNSDTKLSTIYKIASHLDIEVVDLLKGYVECIPAGPKLFVKGEVSAAVWKESCLWGKDDWLSMTGMPNIDASLGQRYFLKVRGDSMDVRFPEGTFVECVEIEAGRQIPDGKVAVVLRRRRDGLVELSLKEMILRDSVRWLLPRSSNPNHQAFRMDQLDEEIEEITILAFVISSVKME